MVRGIGIAIGIVSVFLLIGSVLPFINSAFGSGTTYNNNDISNEISQKVQNVSPVSALDVIISIFTMFFWTFGALPWWLDSVFVVFRVALVMILVQYIPFIG